MGMHCLLLSHKNDARQKWVNPLSTSGLAWASTRERPVFGSVNNNDADQSPQMHR